jgi:hypothetical protein
MRKRHDNDSMHQQPTPHLVATPQQLAMIAQVMDAYSTAFALDDPAKRERIGSLLLECLEAGARTVDELADALDEHIGKGCMR